MWNVTNEVYLLLRRIFTVVTNLSECGLGISQKKFRRVKIDERLKYDANVTNFAGWLPLHFFIYSSIWVVLSNRQNIAKFIQIKFIW